MSASQFRLTFIGFLTVAVLAFPPVAGAGLTVESGWDLLVTVPDKTLFMEQHWVGVPIGPYDLGGSLGVRDLGPADTLIRRPEAAQVSAYGESAAVPMEIAALQMKSDLPFDPDEDGPAPLAYYFVTLAAPSAGTVTINFDHEPGDPPHGRFNTIFDVNWGLHLGDLEGPLLATGVVTLGLDGACWDHEKTPPYGGVPLIEGVNYKLNGLDTKADFHLAFDPNAGPGEPGGPNTLTRPCWGPDHPWYTDKRSPGPHPPSETCVEHSVTECPEPATGAFLAAMALLAGGVHPPRRRAGTPQ